MPGAAGQAGLLPAAPPCLLTARPAPAGAEARAPPKCWPRSHWASWPVGDGKVDAQSRVWGSLCSSLVGWEQPTPVALLYSKVFYFAYLKELMWRPGN